jgi:hypothetical protein
MALHNIPETPWPFFSATQYRHKTGNDGNREIYELANEVTDEKYPKDNPREAEHFQISNGLNGLL